MLIRMDPQLAITVVKRNEDTASVKATVVPSLGRLGGEDAYNKASGNSATTIQVVNSNMIAYAHSFAVRILHVLRLVFTLPPTLSVPGKRSRSGGWRVSGNCRALSKTPAIVGVVVHCE